jgi:hypothetical protein
MPTDTNQEIYPFAEQPKSKTEDVVEGAFSKIQEFIDDPRWIVKEILQVQDDKWSEFIERQENDETLSTEEPPKMDVERAVNEVRRCDLVIDNFGGKISDIFQLTIQFTGKMQKVKNVFLF